MKQISLLLFSLATLLCASTIHSMSQEELEWIHQQYKSGNSNWERVVVGNPDNITAQSLEYLFQLDEGAKSTTSAVLCCTIIGHLRQLEENHQITHGKIVDKIATLYISDYMSNADKKHAIRCLSATAQKYPILYQHNILCIIIPKKEEPTKGIYENISFFLSRFTTTAQPNSFNE
jgi:hypothetical protein